MTETPNTRPTFGVCPRLLGPDSRKALPSPRIPSGFVTLEIFVGFVVLPAAIPHLPPASQVERQTTEYEYEDDSDRRRGRGLTHANCSSMVCE